MTQIVTWLEGRAWQVATYSCGILIVVLGGLLAVTSFQKSGIERDLARSEAALTKANVNLDRCGANTENLKKAIEDRNTEIMRVSRAGADKLRAAEEAVSAARGQAAKLNARIELLMQTPALGATPCARFDEVDRAVQEAFQ